MSDKYQQPTVPHYAPVDSSRVVPPHLNPDAESDWVRDLGGLKAAASYRDRQLDLRDQIRGKWVAGDLFRCAFPVGHVYEGLYGHIENRLGKFVEARYRRDYAVDVVVEWLEESPVSAGHKRWKMRNRRNIGGGVFLRSAVKVSS